MFSNAIKFTERGFIEVRVGLENEESDSDFYRIRIAVADTGIGIPEERRDRLFQSFSQVDASIPAALGERAWDWPFASGWLR